MEPAADRGASGPAADQFLEMAAALLNRDGTGAPENGARQEPDLARLLDAMLRQRSEQVPPREEAPAPEPDRPAQDGGRLSAIATALPQMMQAMSGNAELLSADKVNLVKAIRPYMAESRAGSVDRAIRIANMTKAAKNALNALRR